MDVFNQVLVQRFLESCISTHFETASMSSITPPTQLATFSSSYASSSKLPHVSLSPVHGRQSGLAVAAAQGDGVWTYDLATLRPTTSFTVPPSTVFATPPLSYYPSTRSGEPRAAADEGEDDEDSSRITIVGVQRGQNILTESIGKVLWWWKGEDGTKSVIELHHPVLSLHHLGNPRAAVLCTHSDGHLTVLEPNLHIRRVNYGTLVPKHIIASHIISVSSQSARVALVDKKGAVAVIELDLGGTKEVMGQSVKSFDLLDWSKGSTLSSASISGTGVTAVTTGKTRYLVSKSLADPSDSTKTFPTFVHQNTSALLPLPVPGRPLAVVAVNDPSPTILLLSTSASLPAVLLSSSLATLAPTASSSITYLSILDTPAPGRFVLGVTLTYTSEDGGRTVVYTLELAVPPAGVGMSGLIGTFAATKQYLAIPGRHTKVPAFDSFVTNLAHAVGSGTGYDVFEKWLKAEQERFKSQDNAPHVRFTLPEQQVRAIIRTVFDAALRRVESGDEGDVESVRLEPTGRYDPRIITSLLSTRSVQNDMYDPDVLSSLLVLSDWTNASKVTRSMGSIPSSSIVSMIQKSIHPPIDIEAQPTLSSALRDVLSTPVPAPDYRLALRSGLSVEDATEVLGVYVGWMDHLVDHSADLLKGWTEEKKTRKQRDAEREREELDPIPSLEAIINHSSTLLDSHLPLFLNYPPSHAPLESLQESLGPLLALQDNYRKLRAPVEAALTLSKREDRKAEEAEAKREQIRLNTAQNGKGKPADSRAKTGAILADEGVGKWRVESFVF